MTEPVSESRIDHERVDEKYAASNSEKVSPEPKSKITLQNPCDEEQYSLQHEECGEDQSGVVDDAKEP